MLVSLLVSPSFAIVNQKLPCYALGLPVCAVGTGSYKSLLSGHESVNKSPLDACPDQECNNKFPVSGGERRNKERDRIFTHVIASACMGKESLASPLWQSGSGSIFHPAIASCSNPTGCPAQALCMPAAPPEVPTHPCTSSPPYSISLPWLPPSAWELPEITRRYDHSSHTAPCHLQFPEVLFSGRQSPSKPHAHLLLSSCPSCFILLSSSLAV